MTKNILMLGCAVLIHSSASAEIVASTPTLDIESPAMPKFMPAFLSEENHKIPYYMPDNTLVVYDSDFNPSETFPMRDKVEFEEIKCKVEGCPRIFAEAERSENTMITDGWTLDQAVDFINRASGADSYTTEEYEGGYIFYPAPIEANLYSSFLISEIPGAVYDFDYKYPTRYARLTANGEFNIGNISYKPTDDYEPKKILREGDVYLNSYPLTVMADAQDDNSCIAVRTAISQNFFNDDDAFELLQYNYTLTPEEYEEKSDYFSDLTVSNRFAYKTGINIVSTDGNTLGTIEANVYDIPSIFILDGKKYLSLTVRENGTDYTKIYRVETAGSSAVSLREIPVSMKVYPNPAQVSEPVEADLGRSVMTRATIYVTAADGRTVMTGFAEPGTRTVNLDVTSLTPGLYIVNVKEDGVSREGCRLLIR